MGDTITTMQQLLVRILMDITFERVANEFLADITITILKNKTGNVEQECGC